MKQKMRTYQDKNSPLYQGLPFMEIGGSPIPLALPKQQDRLIREEEI